MSSTFVPFLKRAGKPPAPGPPASGWHGDSVAVSGAFATKGADAAAGPPNCGPAGSGAARPIVTMQKDGDRVTHIRIQCVCGEVVELECAY